jgi:hypothetical protein
MSARTARWLLLGILGLPALAGCAGPSDTAAGQGQTESDAGKIGLELDFAGLDIQTVSYVITGPGAFAKSGNIDVSGATKISALIGGLPAGSGFAIVLSTTLTDPAATCSGSAGFDVTAGATTSVPLTIDCHLPHDTGGVAIDAGINICPVLDDLSATPGEVSVGSAITLGAVAHDSDAGPSPISYQWSTSAGSLVSAGPGATLTCTAPGPITVTVSASDGTADCADSQQVSVSCSGGGAGSGAGGLPQPAPIPAPFVLLLAAGLLWLGCSRAIGSRANAG